MNAEEFLRRLRSGGKVVSSSACDGVELSLARLDRRMWVDADGFGYVYMPPAAAAPARVVAARPTAPTECAA